MSYDEHGRWVPSEDINWSQDRQALRMELTQSGLDWRHEGKYAFRTDAWGQMTESQRLDTLQAYDSWYDEGGQLDLNDEAWGLDIERGLTYNNTWDAQTAFNQLTGGSSRHVEVKMTRESLENPEHKRNKLRHTIVGVRHDAQGHEYTTYIEREHPMDWKNYSTDELYRATIDELLEKDYNMFMGPGDDFNNATQVREATKEIKSWVNEAYAKANELGKNGEWAEAESQKDKALQIQRAKITNVRYPEGRKAGGAVGGPLHNQQIAIRKYQPWNKFDPETGIRTKVNPLTGEIRDTFKHKIVPEPTRMTIVGDKFEQNRDEGVFYSPTLGLEQEITDSMLAKPPELAKPNLSIRGVTPERPGNIDADWQLKGQARDATTQGAGS